MVNRVNSFATASRSVTGVDDRVALRAASDGASFVRPAALSHRGTWLKGRPASLAIALVTARCAIRVREEGGV
jgi:hypothetical protein